MVGTKEASQKRGEKKEDSINLRSMHVKGGKRESARSSAPKNVFGEGRL